MSGPPRVVARARTAVRASLMARLEELADRTDPAGLSPRILVAVSGGADSLALMATAAWVGSRMGLEAEAAIIDHGLAADSRSVAERAASACERLGAVRTHIRAVDLSAPDGAASGGLENAARTARHRALEGLREERDALAILLGHTLDDQAEQVLMALARGSGPRALAGMPARRGAILRPFLDQTADESAALRRADTEEICTLHDVSWWEDPMNADTSMLRARVRHEVMPLLRDALGPQIDENLARSAALVRPDSEHLDAEALGALEALARPLPSSGEGALLALDAHALAAHPAPIRTRVLREASRRAADLAATPSGKSLLRRQVLACDALLVSWHGQAGVPLPGRIELARRDGLLIWRAGAAGPRRT